MSAVFPIESLKKSWYRAANIITSVRLLLFWVPAVLLIAHPDNAMARWWAVVSFLLIAITDALDGWVARHFNQVSEWGKFLDPLVDKFLVVATMLGICIVYLNPWLCVVLGVIVLREVVVTLQIRTRGKLVAASWSGKIKMLSQVLMLLAWLAPLPASWWQLRVALTVIALATTLYSWWRYYELFVKVVDET